MSKTAITGLVAIVIVIIGTFLPWVSIVTGGQELVFTGLQTEGSSFGEPGKLSIFVAVLTGILFLIPKDWSPKINLFTSAFLVAWTFRNLLLYSRCEMGICPDQKAGLYICLAGAVTAFICVLMHRRTFVKK